MQNRRSLIKTVAAAAAGTALASVPCIAFAEETEQAKPANRVCELLGIEKPVIQANMNSLSTPELAAAVSNAGGLGLISYCEDEVEDVKKTQSLTDKPFAIHTYRWSDELCADLRELGATIAFVTGMGTSENGYAVDVDTIKYLKEQGFTVLFRDVNPTVPAMITAQDAGADIIIASGYGQGGHITETRITLSSMLAEARPQIAVPLVASGCIVDAATASAAAALGAEGAYVGTRFNASVESPCSDAAKEIIVNTRAEDLVEWKGLVGFVRGNDNEMSRKCIEMANAGATREEISDVYQQSWKKGMREGDVENWVVSMNDAVNSITSIKTCQEIVDDIASGFGC